MNRDTNKSIQSKQETAHIRRCESFKYLDFDKYDVPKNEICTISAVRSLKLWNAEFFCIARYFILKTANSFTLSCVLISFSCT